MEVVLLINLPLHLALDTQTHDIGISLACDCRGVGVGQSQRLLECCYTLPCSLLFLLDVVLEVARQRLNLLYLLRKISPEAAELVDDVGLNVPCFVGLKDGLLVEIAEDAVSVVESSFYEESGGGIGVVYDIRDLQQRFGAVLV